MNLMLYQMSRNVSKWFQDDTGLTSELEPSEVFGMIVKVYTPKHQELGSFSINFVNGKFSVNTIKSPFNNNQLGQILYQYQVDLNAHYQALKEESQSDTQS